MLEYSDNFIKSVLQNAKTIAVVGVSSNPVRPSYFVARYMFLKGYTVIPVNPAYVGQELFGQPVHADLTTISQPVDMVDIFRRSDFVPDIVDQAIAHLSDLKSIWMQIGVRHADAATKSRAAGLDVIEDLCPKMQHQRLFGELRKGGFNTGVISSKL
ncbi:MAG: CoA-binding protein [Aliishimia sp.]